MREVATVQRILKRRRDDPSPGIPGCSFKHRKKVAGAADEGACLRRQYLKVQVSGIVDPVEWSHVNELIFRAQIPGQAHAAL